VEWQKYDANMHIMMMKEHSELLSVNTLNVDRIKILMTLLIHWEGPKILM
jgi:hypothetical protein